MCPSVIYVARGSGHTFPEGIVPETNTVDNDTSARERYEEWPVLVELPGTRTGHNIERFAMFTRNDQATNAVGVCRKGVCTSSNNYCQGREPTLLCSLVCSHRVLGGQTGGFLGVLEGFRVLSDFDVRGGAIGQSDMPRRAVARQLQRTIVERNCFSERTFPSVQDAYGSERKRT